MLASALQSYIDNKGKYSIVRKVYAPIWVNGPVRSFVSERTITVGDAAGQSKPTTAGGIYTCGMGGVLAGRALVNAADKKYDERQKQAGCCLGSMKVTGCLYSSTNLTRCCLRAGS